MAKTFNISCLLSLSLSLSCNQSNTGFTSSTGPVKQTGDAVVEADDENVILPAPDPEPEDISSDDILDLCSVLTEKTLTQNLSFPATSDCSFGENGNLGRRDLHIQAIGVQTDTLSLPNKDSIICSLSMSSQSDALQYDDLLILTIEEEIILSSNQSFFSRLNQKEGIFRWSFEDVRGLQVNFNAQPYCLGDNNSLCQIPETDTAGTLSVNFLPEDFKELSLRLLGKKDLKVNLIATGDDNDGDCMHSDFSMTYQVTYVDANDR